MWESPTHETSGLSWNALRRNPPISVPIQTELRYERIDRTSVISHQDFFSLSLFSGSLTISKTPINVTNSDRLTPKFHNKASTGKSCWSDNGLF